jgi:hypothetical protein
LNHIDQCEVNIESAFHEVVGIYRVVIAAPSTLHEGHGRLVDELCRVAIFFSLHVSAVSCHYQDGKYEIRRIWVIGRNLDCPTRW